MSNAPHSFPMDRIDTQTTLFIDPETDATDPRIPTNLCLASGPSDFDLIRQPGKNLLVYFWEPNSAMKAAIDNVNYDDLPTFEITTPPTDDLKQLPGKCSDVLVSRVLSQMSPAIQSFAKLLPGKGLEISFFKTQSKPCPLFHTDRIPLWLIGTLRGPGTEWLPDDMANRKGLGSGDNRKIVRPSAIIKQMDRFHIGILKGKSYQGNHRSAIVHRSPEVAEWRQGRWYLRIDPR